MSGKREPPFSLNIDFDEAITRFVRVVPLEMPFDKSKPQVRRPRMSRDGEPFVFTLWPAEIEQIVEKEVKGAGGLQSLLRKLQEELSHGNTVSFDNAGLGQLIRYMTKMGNGGFEGRLRRAFVRSIFDLFTFSQGL